MERQVAQRRNRLLCVTAVGLTVCALAQKPAVTLTAPNSRAVHVQSSRPNARFTQPSGPETVPYQISPYDAEQHEGFVRNEDALSNKIDLLDAHLTDGLKALTKTVDADHTDLESLKDTRSTWQAYLLVGSLLVSVVVFVFGKDKISAWFNKNVLHKPAQPPGGDSQ